MYTINNGVKLHHIEFNPERVVNFSSIPFPRQKSLKKGRIKHLTKVFHEGTYVELEKVKPLLNRVGIVVGHNFGLKDNEKDPKFRLGYYCCDYHGDLYIFFNSIYLGLISENSVPLTIGSYNTFVVANLSYYEPCFSLM